MLRRRQFVVQRNQYSAAKENRIRRNQPLRLIRHDDRSPVAHFEIGVLERATQRPCHFLEIGISKPHLLAVAIGFNQASFVGPAIESSAQSRAQAGILMEIKHYSAVSPQRHRGTERNKSLSERALVRA